MRTWGRVFPATGDPYWVEVTTDANGYNDAVWIVTLEQCLKLNLGESPIYGNYGVPSQQSVVTQVFPDYYVLQTQQQFSAYFASLQVSRLGLVGSALRYEVNVVTNAGAIIPLTIPVPQ